jgi:pre-mRNA-splicing factor SPF27
MAGKALQLAAYAHGEGTGWRKGQGLIDALPYVDGLSAAEKQQVDALIEDEMRRSSKRPADYLQELPPVPEPNYRGQEAIEKELER